MANQFSEPPLNGYEIAYSKASYKRDAAFLIAVHEEIEQGGFPQLQELFRDSDIREARIILKLVKADRRAELRDQANTAIHSQNTSASTAATFTQFLSRFRSGPTEIDEERDPMEQHNERAEKSRPTIGVIMGSDSDLKTLVPGLQVLESYFGIKPEVEITSAHRTPDYMATYASSAASRGIKVLIAAAGGAAHLPGMAAAHTSLPVIGVPIKGTSLGGLDSLYSIVQMPRGVPVATVGVNNSVNAALLAARIIGAFDAEVQKKVENYAANAARENLELKGAKLKELGWEKYLQEMEKR